MQDDKEKAEGTRTQRCVGAQCVLAKAGDEADRSPGSAGAGGTA